MRYPISILFFLFLCFSGQAQYQVGVIPRVSPDKGVYQKIAFTDININYGSPKVKDRDIWGDLVPFDEVWRAGANEATTFEFSEDVYLEGNLLRKGKYSFFVIPKIDQAWTVIFNKAFKQWGAYTYEKTEDVLRFDVEIQGVAHSEELEYHINNLGLDFGTISLMWEDVKLEFNIETNYLEILTRRLDEKLNKVPENIKWVVYIQASEFLLTQGHHLELALEWINNAESLYTEKGNWHRQYYPKNYVLGHLYWTKSSILAGMGQYSKAVDYANKLKVLDGEINFYKQENEFGELDEYISEWEKLK